MNPASTHHVETEPLSTTAIISHGTIDTAARETYGNGPTVLRIGNGGAGATGLISVLCKDYLSTLADIFESGSIDWVCNHSRNTQLALLHGSIDIALIYERDQELLAESEGWSHTVGCMFHDHFCLAGPSGDPGEIFAVENDLLEAFRRIAQQKVLFYSRADMSATMWKERSIWQKIEVKPWEDMDANLERPQVNSDGHTDTHCCDGGNDKRWYHTNQLSPADALIAADQAGAYLLTDRSTLLSLVKAGKIHNTTVYIEPDAADHLLMNSCYASVATRPVSEERRRASESFLQYLLSERGQDVVAKFGLKSNEETDGVFPLFARVRDGYASTFLRGGVPNRDRCWITRSIRGELNLSR